MVSYIERPLLGDSPNPSVNFTSSSCSFRKTFIFLLLAVVFCGLLAGNLYQGFLLEQNRPMIKLRARERLTAERNVQTNNTVYNLQLGKDVLVFLQIQNAGANFFEKHLIEDLDLEKPCVCVKRPSRKQCRCLDPVTHSPWLFSRLSAGWRCGVHPDWTELNGCVDRVLDELKGKPVKRRYLYVTILRDPVRRFRSEWQHFVEQRGSRPSRHLCGGHEYSLPDVQNCFAGRNPATVSLEEFASCKDNLALNRQTRMLADLQLVNCYDQRMNTSHRDMILLHSARSNLHRMAYFGLSEFPNISQKMFESAFDLHFVTQPHHRFNRLSNYLKNSKKSTTFEGVVREANYLDVQLYEYAKELFFERFHQMFKNKDEQSPGSDTPSQEIEDPDWADGEDIFMDR